MSNNLTYGGIVYPDNPFVFDKIYQNLNEAKSKVNEDSVLVGRYILIAYCNTAFGKDARINLETAVNNGYTPIKLTDSDTDEDKYKQHYYEDKTFTKKAISKDRVVCRKVYKNNKYDYEEIAYLHSDLSNDEIAILGISDDDKILKINEEGRILSSSLKLEYDNKGGHIYLKGMDDVTISSVDTSDFIADGMLSTVTYNDQTNKLIFTWNIWDIENNRYDTKTTEIDLYDIIDPYASGDGIIVDSIPNENPKIKIKLDSTSDNFLSLSSNGLKLSGVQDAINNIKNKVYVKNSKTELDNITAQKNIGDIGIVITTISDNKVSRTAYVWNGGVWEAMDGNYNANNVYIGSNITIEGNFSSIGNYSKGTIIEAGTSLSTILNNMLQKELYPTSNDKPNAAITVSGGSGEVGSTYSLPKATLTITDVGSYEYGDKSTGITFSAGTVKLAEGSSSTTATNYVTNSSIMTKGSTLTLTASGNSPHFTDSSISYTFSATASYPTGKIPVTNLGNTYPYAQIPAGNITIPNKTVTFTGYRYAFAGGTNATSINSNIVRSMPKVKNSKISMDTQNEALEFTAYKGDTKVFFAYPATWTGTPYFEIFGLAWGETTGFIAKSNIQVADYRGNDGYTAYKLYVWEPGGGALTADETKFRVWFK